MAWDRGGPFVASPSVGPPGRPRAVMALRPDEAPTRRTWRDPSVRSRAAGAERSVALFPTRTSDRDGAIEIPSGRAENRIPGCARGTKAQSAGAAGQHQFGHRHHDPVLGLMTYLCVSVPFRVPRTRTGSGALHRGEAGPWDRTRSELDPGALDLDGDGLVHIERATQRSTRGERKEALTDRIPVRRTGSPFPEREGPYSRRSPGSRNTRRPERGWRVLGSSAAGIASPRSGTARR
jgi:hypothetical protein